MVKPVYNAVIILTRSIFRGDCICRLAVRSTCTTSRLGTKEAYDSALLQFFRRGNLSHRLGLTTVGLHYSYTCMLALAQESGQIPEAHDIFLRWTPVWLAAEEHKEFHQLDSLVVHNPTLMKTLCLSSVSHLWWVHHKGRNLSKC